MTGVRQALGAWGERTAEAYLTGGGIIVIDRNWRRRGGEIDLVAMDGETVVFCEVKTRRGTAFGPGIESVTVRQVPAPAPARRHLAGSTAGPAAVCASTS